MRMSEATLSDQIELLRVQLETALPTPALLVISSARDADGKGLIASALASSMDAAGYSTLLIRSDEKISGGNGAPQPESLDEVVSHGISRYAIRNSHLSTSVMLLSGDRIRHSISREGMTRFGQACRETYQVTIVDAATALANSFALLAAVIADGVLLSVREGRRVRAEDRQLAKVLAREQASFLGVVAVAAALIRDDPQPVPSRATLGKPSVATVKGDTARERQAV